MSQTTCVSEAVADVAAMIKSGNLRDAKRTTAQLLDNVHPSVLAILRECADILSRPNTIARPKLTALWQRSDQTNRKIIEACAPTRDEWDHRQVPEQTADQPRRRPETTHPEPVATRHGKRASRAELHNRRAQHKARKDAAAYFASRTEIDDQPRQDDQPDGYALDYDQAAVPALRGTPCVSCWLERSSADQAARPDDGLCGDCREKCRPGIPALSAGHTRAQAITARCTFLATHNPPTAAVLILRAEWERATDARHRVIIADWVKANRPLIDAPTPATLAVIGQSCRTCGSTHRVRDGECSGCRALTPQPDPAGPSAAARAPELIAA